MDILPILERCIAIEGGAARIYDRLAEQFAEDAGFSGFWRGMAKDEREHGHKLETWRALLELTPESRRPEAEGFAESLPELEKLVLDSEKAAPSVTTADEAFSIALALERSELDVIYTTLIQSSPIKRFPDVEATRHHELGRHHEALIREIRERSGDSKNRYEAELIAHHD